MDVPERLRRHSEERRTVVPVAPDEPSYWGRRRWGVIVTRLILAAVLAVLLLLSAVLFVPLSGPFIDRRVERWIQEATGLDAKVHRCSIDLAGGHLSVDRVMLQVPGAPESRLQIGEISCWFSPMAALERGFLDAELYVRARAGESFRASIGPEGFQLSDRLTSLVGFLRARAQASTGSAITPRSATRVRPTAALPFILEIYSVEFIIERESRVFDRTERDRLRVERLRCVPDLDQWDFRAEMARGGQRAPVQGWFYRHGREHRWRLEAGEMNSRAVLPGVSWGGISSDGRIRFSRGTGAATFAGSLAVTPFVFRHPRRPGNLDLGPMEISVSGRLDRGHLLPAHLAFIAASPSFHGGGDGVRRQVEGFDRFEITAALDWMTANVVHYIWDPPRPPISPMELVEGPVALRLTLQENEGGVWREGIQWRLDANDALVRVDREDLHHLVFRLKIALAGDFWQMGTIEPARVRLPSGRLMFAEFSSVGRNDLFDRMKVDASAWTALTREDLFALLKPEHATTLERYDPRFVVAIEAKSHKPHDIRESKYEIRASFLETHVELPRDIVDVPLVIDRAEAEMDRARIDLVSAEGRLGDMPIAASGWLEDGRMRVDLVTETDLAPVKQAFLPILWQFHLAGRGNAEASVLVAPDMAMPGRTVESIERVAQAIARRDVELRASGEISEASFAHLSMPVVLSDLTGRVGFQNRTLTFDGLEGEAGRSGAIEGSAEVFIPRHGPPRVSAEVEVEDFHIDDWATAWYSLGEVLGPAEAARLDALREDRDFGGEREFRLDLGVRADAWIWRNLRGENLEANLEYSLIEGKRQQLWFPHIRGQLYGGNADLALWLNLPPGGVSGFNSFRVGLDLQRAELGPLLDDYLGTREHVSGAMNLRLEGRGTFELPDDREGWALVDISDTNLLRVPFFTPLAEALGLGSDALRQLGALRGNVYFREGRAWTEDLVLRHPLVVLLFRGSVTVDGALDVRILARIIERWTSRIPILNLIGAAFDDVSNQILSLRMSGTVHDPSVGSGHVRNLTEDLRNLFMGEPEEPMPVELLNQNLLEGEMPDRL